MDQPDSINVQYVWCDLRESSDQTKNFPFISIDVTVLHRSVIVIVMLVLYFSDGADNWDTCHMMVKCFDS